MRPDADHIELHPLLYKEEDGEWIVGRVNTGQFVGLPAEAVTFLRELEHGGSVRGAQDRVREQQGTDIDGTAFVADLIDLEFVAKVGDKCIGEPPPPPSLPWLRAPHVRWVFSNWITIPLIIYILIALIISVVHQDLIPTYRTYFIIASPGVDLTFNTVAIVIIIGVHEFWHLAAARIDGVYARIGLGTRLQFLVAQTTVTGLWGAQRKTRLRVYLAGIVSDLAIVSTCLLALLLLQPGSLAYRAVNAIVLGVLLSVGQQFAFFMKTDVYLVAQEFARCKNLYHDASEYTLYICRCIWAKKHSRALPDDPTVALPQHERGPVKAYSVLMVLGSALALTIFAFYEGPILFFLFDRAVLSIARGVRTGNFGECADGALVLVVEGSLQALLLKLLIAKHGQKLRKLFTTIGYPAHAAE